MVEKTDTNCESDASKEELPRKEALTFGPLSSILPRTQRCKAARVRKLKTKFFKKNVRCTVVPTANASGPLGGHSQAPCERDEERKDSRATGGNTPGGYIATLVHESLHSAQSKRDDATSHHTADAEIVASDTEDLCHVCLSITNILCSVCGWPCCEEHSMNSNGDIICDICCWGTPIPILFDTIPPNGIIKKSRGTPANATSVAGEEDNVPTIVTINEAKMHTIMHDFFERKTILYLKFGVALQMTNHFRNGIDDAVKFVISKSGKAYPALRANCCSNLLSQIRHTIAGVIAMASQSYTEEWREIAEALANAGTVVSEYPSVEEQRAIMDAHRTSAAVTSATGTQANAATGSSSSANAATDQGSETREAQPTAGQMPDPHSETSVEGTKMRARSRTTTWTTSTMIGEQRLYRRMTIVAGPTSIASPSS